MWLIDKLAEEHIREAQARGAFDRLPGAGRPLQLDDDAGVPVELRAGYRLLRNAGCLAPELQLRREITRVEQLLALAGEPERRVGYSRRLAWLVTSLNLTRPGPENLPLQQACFERLCRGRLPGDGGAA